MYKHEVLATSLDPNLRMFVGEENVPVIRRHIKKIVGDMVLK